MALTKKDLLEFGQQLKHELKTELQHDMTVALDQQRTDIVRDMRDEMDARFAASHNRMRHDMHSEIQHLRTEVLDVLTQNVMPAIDFVHQDLKREIAEIRHFVRMPAA